MHSTFGIWYTAVKRVIITPSLHNNVCTCFKNYLEQENDLSFGIK